MRFSASVVLAVLLASSFQNVLAVPILPENSLVTRDAPSLMKRFSASLPHNDRYRYNEHMLVVTRDGSSAILPKRELEDLTLRDLGELKARGFLSDLKNTQNSAKETFRAGQQAYINFRTKWHAKRELVERDVVLDDILKRDFKELTLRNLAELEARGFVSDVRNTWDHAKATYQSGRQTYDNFRAKWYGKRHGDGLVERDNMLEDIMKRDFEELTIRDLTELEARGFISDLKNTWGRAKATFNAGRQAYNSFRTKWHWRHAVSPVISRIHGTMQRLHINLDDKRTIASDLSGMLSVMTSTSATTLWGGIMKREPMLRLQIVFKVPIPSPFKRELVERDIVLEDILKRDYEELAMRDLEELEARGFLSVTSKTPGTELSRLIRLESKSGETRRITFRTINFNLLSIWF